MTDDEFLSPVSFRGLQGYCTAYAQDQEGAVYVSFIGRKTALTGIWAAFADQDHIVMLNGPRLIRRTEPEAAKYTTLKVQLAESGWWHMVLLHTQATVTNLPDQAFFVLATGHQPPIELFWTQWNRALPYPARPEWAGQLWQQGIAATLIEPIQAESIHAWHVRATGDWIPILQALTTA